jgi:hypothetical protein
MYAIGSAADDEVCLDIFFAFEHTMEYIDYQ